MVCFNEARVERFAVVGIAEAMACETAPGICCAMVRLRSVKLVDRSRTIFSWRPRRSSEEEAVVVDNVEESDWSDWS